MGKWWAFAVCKRGRSDDVLAIVSAIEWVRGTTTPSSSQSVSAKLDKKREGRKSKQREMLGLMSI